ncbi:hypothetical protein FHX40_4998 [Thermopolyspora flexuosa]|uniref:Uncharacterized protein n=1 Tax=Thermopolyspora flexuosa TaxID=103836 RepID=A0A543IP88_9ACTN|nr:hypothetical protein FHX40_4998 [Thermopolyspora flexuosa]
MTALPPQDSLWSTASGRETSARPDRASTGTVDTTDGRDNRQEAAQRRCRASAGARPSPATRPWGEAKAHEPRDGTSGPACGVVTRYGRRGGEHRSAGRAVPGRRVLRRPRRHVKGDIPGPGENPPRNASVGAGRRPGHPAGSGGAPFGETARCEGWGTTTERLRNGPTLPTTRRLSVKGAFPWTTATAGTANTASAPRSPRHAPFRGEPGTFPPRNRHAERSEHGAVFPRQMTETSISAGASRKILSAMRSIRPSQPYASPAAKSTMRVASAVAMPATSMTTAQPSRKC